MDFLGGLALVCNCVSDLVSMWCVHDMARSLW
jgi:hypothetical protein